MAVEMQQHEEQQLLPQTAQESSEAEEDAPGRHAFLASIKGLARPDMLQRYVLYTQCVWTVPVYVVYTRCTPLLLRRCTCRVGERLYTAIALSHPESAGALTGGFLDTVQFSSSVQ
jgi:hypothetical protein